MYKTFFTFCFIIFFFSCQAFSQSTGNIPLKIKTKFNRQYGAGDIWGVKINNINYALVTLDGGLSIVTTNNVLALKNFPFANLQIIANLKINV